MLKAAIIGFGWWGKTLAGYLADSDAMRVALAVEPQPAPRAAAAAMGLATAERFEDALAADIDAIIICSPHFEHAAQIVAAARAGKHVFCEKPLCVTGEEVERALAEVKRAGVRIGVGHERRFEPAIIELRKRFAAGEFGSVLAMEGNFSQDKFLALPPDNWRLSPTLAPVGPLSATGVHLVDLAVSIFGEPVEAFARLGTYGTSFANGDTLTVTLAFESGKTAQIAAMLTTPFMGRVCVFGSQGWMEICDRTHPEQPSGWDVTTALRGKERETRFFPPHPAVRDNLEAFARAARGGQAYPVDHAQMSATVRAFEAITRSAASGRIEPIARFRS